MNKRERRRKALRTFRELSQMTPEMKTYFEERQVEIIAFLETVYQDWDNPEQENTQRRCHV